MSSNSESDPQPPRSDDAESDADNVQPLHPTSHIAATTAVINDLSLPFNQASRLHARQLWTTLKADFAELPPVVAPQDAVPSTLLEPRLRLGLWCVEELYQDSLEALARALLRPTDIKDNPKRVGNAFGTTGYTIILLFGASTITCPLRKALCKLKRELPDTTLAQVLRACLGAYVAFREHRSARTRSTGVATVVRSALRRLW